jgi:hypothetical protein
MLARAFRAPLVRLSDESAVFPFNLIRIPASNDVTEMERMVAQSRALHDRIRKRGRGPISGRRISHVARQLERSLRVEVAALARGEAAVRPEQRAHPWL